MRSTGSCSQSAKSPGKAPGGSVRRVAGGTSTLDLADSGPPLHAASSLAKGHHRQGGAATVTPTGPADVPARSIQQRLGRGNGSASLTLDLRLPASVVSNRTAGYPGSGSPRSSMVPVGAGGLRSGKQVEAALRHSLLLAESSAPALASSLSADKSVPHLAESLSVGSMAFRANARGQAFDPHSSILSPGGGVVGGASGLVRPSMRHIASVQRPVSGMHGKHQQLGGISFERSTLVNYQQAGPSKAPAFARWTPGAGGLRAWVADQGGSGLVRSPPSRGVHQRQQPNGSGRPASSHMALNKGTKDMVSGAKALDFSHRYNIAIPSQRA